jgi:hypothetical protein
MSAGVLLIIRPQTDIHPGQYSLLISDWMYAIMNIQRKSTQESITSMTSNSQAMVALARPVLSLSYAMFLLLWGVIGILGLVKILGLTIPIYFRSY